MKILLHTTAIGTSTTTGFVDGTIIGAATCTKDDASFDGTAFANVGRAVVELPSDASFGDFSYIARGGSNITPLAGGFHDATTFADAAALEADITDPPAAIELYRAEILNGAGTFGYDGANWVDQTGITISKVTGLSITTAGAGYSTGTNILVEPLDTRAVALLIDITSVGASGEITGISVANSGFLWKVGDKVRVPGGTGHEDDEAILEVSSIADA